MRKRLLSRVHKSGARKTGCRFLRPLYFYSFCFVYNYVRVILLQRRMFALNYRRTPSWLRQCGALGTVGIVTTVIWSTFSFSSFFFFFIYTCVSLCRISKTFRAKLAIHFDATLAILDVCGRGRRSWHRMRILPLWAHAFRWVCKKYVARRWNDCARGAAWASGEKVCNLLLLPSKKKHPDIRHVPNESKRPLIGTFSGDHFLTLCQSAYKTLKWKPGQIRDFWVCLKQPPLDTLRSLCNVNIKSRPKFLLTLSEEKKKRKRNSDYFIDAARSSVQIVVGTRDIEAALV